MEFCRSRWPGIAAEQAAGPNTSLTRQTQYLEAGGAFYDIDGDGDLDIVFGDVSGNNLYWWENPYPNFDPNTPWTRHIIKNTGDDGYHDMVFGDFDGDGQTEFVSWNNGNS